jgi:hypothetical protein
MADVTGGRYNRGFAQGRFRLRVSGSAALTHQGDGMGNKLTTALMASTVAVAVIGGGVAFGASTHHAVTACSKKSNHALGLLKHGKCAKGSTKVTLGARGPRGARGPAGPGAVFDTLTGSNNDVEAVFPETVDGLTISTNCGMASSVMISVGPSSGTVDASGTDSHDGTLTPVDAFGAAGVEETGVNQADVDIVVSANGGHFVHLDVHGTWAGNECHYWMVAIPASQAPSSG